MQKDNAKGIELFLFLKKSLLDSYIIDCFCFRRSGWMAITLYVRDDCFRFLPCTFAFVNLTFRLVCTLGLKTSPSMFPFAKTNTWNLMACVHGYMSQIFFKPITQGDESLPFILRQLFYQVTRLLIDFHYCNSQIYSKKC